MIIVIAKVKPKKGMKKNIIEKAENLIKSTRNELGCIEYGLYEPCDDTGLVFIEKWENKDSLKSHLAQDHFIKFGEDTKKFLAEDLEISVYSSDEIEL